ncbi:HGGxSTG domain-containing protein [Pelosinus sp. IPA-1]|uniref:HGGxSTG domain-containing protein n=1 Tax=Pelosinus sp. IPA-1 TaxID=3029569 RepID=UPI002436282E|nr:HGGxSTG domain-containing protein [Pelosinus sp. IPA-1]GMB00088.1 hypothetical protein PIPA1_28870 [Pelosinus sp. IPA-1]
MSGDMAEKRIFHLSADEKNRIEINQAGREYLACGAKLRRKDGFCKFTAGRQTMHKGYGRCHLHGGLTTGPKTDEGKEKVSQNAKKHGFYSNAALTEEEQAAYDLVASQEGSTSLERMIYALKAKIVVYLTKWSAKFAKGGEDSTKVTYKIATENEDGDRLGAVTGVYHAGTIEDRVLLRALNELGRLVERQARLSPDAGGDLLSKINDELQAASHGKITVAWGERNAQERKTKAD